MDKAQNSVFKTVTKAFATISKIHPGTPPLQIKHP
jgi:hypothetical protein